MNLEALSSAFCLPAVSARATRSGSAMDNRRNRNNALIRGRTAAEPKRTQSQGIGNSASNFSIETFLLLLVLTASLLILPLVLPPLPPPPFLLLLVPVGIFVLLLFLAFMTSDVRNITSAL